MGRRIAIAGATGVLGRHILELATGRGHEAIAVSRSRGIDLLSGELASTLEGVEAIVDASGPDSTEQDPATEFFTAASDNMQRAGEAAGIRHLVVLSITGIDRVPYGYYAAKLTQERLAVEGTLPATILRASPFHEFAAQMVRWTRDGSQAKVLDLRVRTIAARSAAMVALDLAEARPQGRVPDICGPEVADLVELARALIARRDEKLKVVRDTSGLGGMPRDAFLPAEGARIIGPTFEGWLKGADATSIQL